jgi:hypothetical protein
MTPFLRIATALLVVTFHVSQNAHTATLDDGHVPRRGFVSSRPADSWEQGLLVGNGIIGASILSRPLDETIVFSHERLFIPERPPLLPPPTGIRLFEIRRLIDRGLYGQAGRLAFEISKQDGFMYPDPLMPAFDLRLQMEADGEIARYERSVDFAVGEASVRWADRRGSYERRMFVSRADGVAVLRVRGPGPGAVNVRLEFAPREPEHKRFKANVGQVATAADGSLLTYRSVFLNAYPGSIHACEGVARIAAKNGTIKGDGSAAIVTGADELLIFIDIALPFDPAETQIETMKQKLAGLPTDYEGLLARHARLHGEIFNRVRLDLGGGAEPARTSEELLAEARQGRPSKALIEKVFDAGRYNILSSTGELPPTLQGVWAGTYDPPWASDFTHNGNVPAAIASMLMGNMPELMRAYTSYIESLVPYLEVNARRIFGARGIVLPSRTTTDGYNNSFNANFPGAFWVAGAPWAAHFFYDYFLYTGDREFLARHALPFMEKAALFFEDYLYEGPDGRYVFSPTQSPENAPSNTKSQTTFNATMDVAAAKELLRNTIEASRELGVNGHMIPKWEAMLAKMPEYLINEDGAIREWLTPRLQDNYNHRHSSHLYALFDGLPTDIERSPELRAAFKRVIELKLERHWANNQRGFMAFGLVQLGQAAASLGEGALVQRCLLPLVTRYWYHNFASTHDDGKLFNMDISGGLPAVMIMALLQSKRGEIRLLPALPPDWPSGTIEGVLARGGIEVPELRWDRDAIRVTLRSAKEQQVVLRVPWSVGEATVSSEGGRLQTDGDSRSRRVQLPAGREVSVTFVRGSRR